MKNYIVLIQSYEFTNTGIAKGKDPYEAIENFVEECITLSYNEFKEREKTGDTVYQSGYSLPYFVENKEDFDSLSIKEITNKYMENFGETVSMSAYEIPEETGKAVVAVEIYGRYQRYTVGTNGKILK